MSDEYRSVSQYNQYERCPYAYHLARREKAWRRPAAWLAQGVAFHEVAEVWLKARSEGRTFTLEDAREAFRASYEREINQACATTPNLDFWFASGPYRGQDDITRRWGIGLGQVEGFDGWLRDTQEVIWVTPDGTPGIELEFDIDLDGVKVRGFIDAVLQMQDGNLLVRDYKTGNKPGDDFQLATYKVAVEDMADVQVTTGEYWMARTSKPAKPFDLTGWTRERITEMFHRLDEDIRAERFDPKPDPQTCRFCDVAAACEYAEG